jgi:glycosyltransferase involved in cell wall biosynthesis
MSWQSTPVAESKREAAATCEYPRVLFVTPHAFNGITGGGITFTNLFRTWPKERLATIHNDPVPTSTEVCDRYYVLTERELALSPLLAWGRQLVGGRVHREAEAHAERENGKGTMASPGSESTGDGIRGFLRKLIGDSVPQRADLSEQLERWIREFRPELLYTILGPNDFMSLVEKIRRRFNLPLVVHVMDDWMSAAYRRGVLAPLMRRQMRRQVTHFFGIARCRIGICHAMCEEYEKRYGYPFVPFQNAIDIERWQEFVRNNAAVSECAEILYVGSVFSFAQLDSLIDCARAVAALNEAGMDVQLRIASPGFLIGPYRHAIEVQGCVTVEDPITDDETFFSRIAGADLLLLPVNFDEESVRFIRYSMPTKVPAYLASGTPILVYGPREVAQVRYAQDLRWGHVVDKRNKAALFNALRLLLTNLDRREDLRTCAQATARKHHDAALVRARFHEVLCRAANV